MKALQADYRLGDLCAASAVSCGGYYRGRHAAPCGRASKDAKLATHLATLHAASRDTYGRPRLMQALRQQGQRGSGKRVARLLHSRGLRGVRRGPFRPQTTEEAEGNR